MPKGKPCIVLHIYFAGGFFDDDSDPRTSVFLNSKWLFE